MAPSQYQFQIDEINDLLYRGNEDVDPVYILTRDLKELKLELKHLKGNMYKLEMEDRRSRNQLFRWLSVLVFAVIGNILYKMGIKEYIVYLLGF